MARDRQRGRRLVVTAVLGVASMCAFIVVTSDDGLVATAARVVRWTARSSLVMFALAYVARPARQLWRNPFTKQLLADRKWLGLGFAISHLAHLIAIVVLASPDFAAFIAARSPTTLFAAFTFVVIFAMAITSIDRIRARIAPPTWKALHRTGMHACWIAFASTYGGAVAADWRYVVPVVLLAAIAIVRFAAFIRLGRSEATITQ